MKGVKMKLWKKIVIISAVAFIILLVIISLTMDKYKLGISKYNKGDYEAAYSLLKQIKPEDKNYADAFTKANISKRIIDSLEHIREDRERINDSLDKKKTEVEERLKIENKKNQLAKENQKKENQSKYDASSSRQEKIERQFSSWDGSHIILTKYIKKSMNDPDSFEHIETSYTEANDYLIIFTKFSGKNSFGGKVKNSIKAKVDLNGEIIEIIE